MKVAIVAFNLDIVAGGNRQIFSLAQQLKAKGHEVTILAPANNPAVFPALQAGLDIRIVPPQRPISWQASNGNIWEKFQDRIERDFLISDTARRMATSMANDFDVINCHDFAYKVGFFYRQKNPRARVIWTMNEPPYGYLPKGSFFRDAAARFYNSLKGYREIRFLSAFDAVVTLDQWDFEWANMRGLNAKIVRSGLDSDVFYAPVRQRLPESKSVKLLAIGTLNPCRRFEDAIEAARLLRHEGYKVSLKVVARNVWREDAYRDFLINLVKDYNLGNCTDLTFDGIDENELRQLYSISDILVHSIYVPPPRHGSTWGLVVFEAMAAGLPVILCRTAGAAEVLVDGKNALFVDPISPGQIAAKIKTLIDDTDFYRNIAEAGQDFVRDNMSWDKYADEMLKIFKGSEEEHR